jgi:L-fucose isomerase-like protein
VKTLIRYIFLVGPPEFPGWKRWGFEEKEDINKEIKSIEKGVVDKLKMEVGDTIELVGGNIISDEQDCLRISESLSEADGLLIFYLIHAPLKSLWAHKIPLIVFLKSKENVWDGNLRTLAVWRDLTKARQTRGIKIVVNDFYQLVESINVINIIKRIKESKLVSIGPPNRYFGSWNAMRKTKEVFSNKVILIDYDTIVKRYREMEDPEEVRSITKKLLRNAEAIALPKENVTKAVKLYCVMKNVLQEKEANAITINCYLGALEALGDVSPCLPLSMLNNEGYVAACESDFPSMLTMLILRNIAEKPVFMADIVVSPKENRILFAHCSSPTKMKGFTQDSEPYLLKTQYESDEKAAIQVKMKEKQIVTLATLSHNFDKMLVTKGKISGNREFPICRTQVEVEIPNADIFLRKFLGFHWMLVYGDHIKKLRDICNFFEIEIEEI